MTIVGTYNPPQISISGSIKVYNGRVVNKYNVPVAATVVLLKDSDHTLVEAVRTDSNGYYEFTSIPVPCHVVSLPDPDNMNGLAND